jgi:hypothetical protein
MAMQPVRCPACHGPLSVVRLVCERCGTAVEGRFEAGLGRLEPDDQRFAHAFLLARGNLRELERTLGLSYAALRGRLDTLVARLEADLAQAAPALDADTAPAPARGVAAVLDALERGEIDATEAARRLRSAARRWDADAGGRDERGG